MEIKRLYTNNNGDFKDKFILIIVILVHTIETHNEISYTKLYILNQLNMIMRLKMEIFYHYRVKLVITHMLIRLKQVIITDYDKILGFNNRTLTEFEIM